MLINSEYYISFYCTEYLLSQKLKVEEINIALIINKYINYDDQRLNQKNNLPSDITDESLNFLQENLDPSQNVFTKHPQPLY